MRLLTLLQLAFAATAFLLYMLELSGRYIVAHHSIAGYFGVAMVACMTSALRLRRQGYIVRRRPIVT